jgi:hypothetical protein
VRCVNRLGEKGQWNLDELKIEFEELILAGAAIEITGFELQEIDQIVLDGEGVEQGPLAPTPGAIAVAHPGDTFQLGAHRVVCGSATDPETFPARSEGATRLVLVRFQSRLAALRGHLRSA